MNFGFLTSQKRKKWATHLAALGLFAATLCWGASFFLVKMATAQVGVWPFLFWRFALASFFIIICFPNKFLNADRDTIYRGFVLGGLLFLAIWTQTAGLQLTSAGKSGFLTSLYVPFVPILGWILLQQKLFFKQVGVACVAVAGLYIMTDSARHDILDGGLNAFSLWWKDINPGDLWTIGAAAFSAIHILMTERYTREEPDSVALGLWMFIGCFAFVIIGTLTQYSGGNSLAPSRWNILNWPSFAISSAIFNAIFTTCFGFIMQIICQKTLGALKAALIFALEAPFSTIFAFLFMGEIFTPKEFIGAAIVFAVSILPDGWLKRG